jgi:uncharacterized DUF497 family protein
MHFEWDTVKDRKNLRKHGVTFEDASSVFYDLLAITGADPDHSEEEERMVTFGVSSSGQFLVIAHTERSDAIRIISARVATKHERQIYEEG